MTDLAIITPTRGRPARFWELVDAVVRTAGLDVQVWAGLDDDDESDYFTPFKDAPQSLILAHRGVRRSLSAWTNDLAKMALQAPDPPRYLASLGDDHRPRTPGWDRRLVEAIETAGGSGFAYGNDLLQGANMPTAWVVSADVVAELGWMMLPGCAHMYVDNAVLELGRAAGAITYRPDVIVEHLHPLAGKAGWDASYRESNAQDRYAVDRAAFEAWKATGLAADAEKVRKLVGERVS
jgi:hypothetical protein